MFEKYVAPEDRGLFFAFTALAVAFVCIMIVF